MGFEAAQAHLKLWGKGRRFFVTLAKHHDKEVQDATWGTYRVPLEGNGKQEQKVGLQVTLFLPVFGGGLCPATVFKKAPGPNFPVPIKNLASHLSSVNFCQKRNWGKLRPLGFFCL